MEPITEISGNYGYIIKLVDGWYEINPRTNCRNGIEKSSAFENSREFKTLSGAKRYGKKFLTAMS